MNMKILDVRRSRRLTTVYFDNAVLDWFSLNDGNLSGTVNRMMLCLLQRCQADKKVSDRVLRAGKKLYYRIDC